MLWIGLVVTALAPGFHGARGLSRVRAPCMSLDVMNLKVSELKDKLKERGLKVSGVKSLLIQRLKDDMDGAGGAQKSAQNNMSPASVAAAPMEPLVEVPPASFDRDGAAGGRYDRDGGGRYDRGDGGRYDPRDDRVRGRGRGSPGSHGGRGGGSPQGRGRGSRGRDSWRSGGATTILNSRPGDWNCPKCHASVFASRAVCFRCDTPNPAGDGGSGGYGTWQGLDGAEGFEAGLEADEEAFRAAFGPAHSSGIDFSSYQDIPVDVKLPRSLGPEGTLPEEVSPVEDFEGLRCGKVLARNLRFAGFSTPTPVQANSVPLAIGGFDVISVAQTGSGKTLAFMLPILRRLLELGSAEGTPGYRDSNRDAPVAIRALVLAPTRELAQQIREESKKFAFRTGIRVGVAYGGTPFGGQMRELERGCDVLVATPGRLDDMIDRVRINSTFRPTPRAGPCPASLSLSSSRIWPPKGVPP